MGATWTAASNSEISFTLDVALARPFTAMVWSRSTSDKSVGGSYSLFSLCNPAQPDEYWKTEIGNDISAERHEGVTNNSGTVSRLGIAGNFLQDTWQHTTSRIVASDTELYLNGVSEDTGSTAAGPPNVTVVGIGREKDSTNDDSWTGQLDHFALFSTSLPDSVIAALGAGANPLSFIGHGLMHYITVISNTQYYDWITERTLTSVGLTEYTGPAAPVAARPDQYTIKDLLLPPMFNAPELLIPGRKPVGPVEIDNANPLSRGLIYCELFTPQKELTGNGRNSAIGGTTKYEISEKGPTLHTDSGAGDYYDSKFSPDLHGSGKQFSVIFMIKGFSAEGTYIAQRDGTNSKWQLFRQAGNIKFYSDITTTTLVSLDDTDAWYTIGISRTQGSDILTYVNGVLVDTTTSAGVGDTGLANISIGNRWEVYPTTGFQREGFFIFAYVWEDRFLTDAEHAEIARDPYQFLKPKHNPVMYLPEPKGFKVPAKQLAAPELLIPGRKPIGPVEIDWTNPLSKGLHHVFLHNSLQGGIKDLVSGLLLPFSDSVTPGDGISLRGDFTRATQDNTEFVGFGDGVVGQTWYPPVVDSTTEISTFQIVRYLGSVGDADEKTLFATSDDADAGSTDLFASAVLEDGKWHSIGSGLSIPENHIEMFEDGISLGGTGSTPTGLNVRVRYDPQGNQYQYRHGINFGNGLRIGNHEQSTNDGWEGDMALSLFWTRYLSPAEHLSLARDPYQFLKPKGVY